MNPDSDLYEPKVLKLVVSPYKNPDLKEDKLLEEIKLRFFLKDIFKVFTFFIYCLKKVKTLDSFRGMFFLVGFFFKDSFASLKLSILVCSVSILPVPLL